LGQNPRRLQLPWLLESRAPWQPSLMRRAAWALGVLVSWVGCSNNPYVIGRVTDAGGGTLDACPSDHPGALVCSGFERADLPGWSAPMIEGSGAIERSSSRAHTGSAALHASTRSTMSVAVSSASFPAVSAGELYLRIYAYVPANVPTETINVLFLGHDVSGATFDGVDLNLQDDALQVYSTLSNPPRQTGTATIPRDRWFCLRVRVALGHADGAVQAYIDDVLALDASGVDTLPNGGVRELHAGVGWSSEQSAFFEIFFDDVVLDHTKVDCLP
jgi:hypothetical protein